MSGIRKSPWLSRERALERLEKMTNKNVVPVDGETLSEAEIELLEYLVKRERKPLRPNQPRYKKYRKAVGIARILGLYPIPSWYRVTRYVTGVDKSDLVGHMLDAIRGAV